MRSSRSTSMTRIPPVTRDALPESQRDAYDRLIATANGASPIGPGSIAANSPELAVRRVAASNYLRFETTIPTPILELAIITTARCLDCAYVWNAHVGAARKAGVVDPLIDALRDRQPLPSADDDDTAVVRYATELFTTHQVSQQTFDDATRRFGTQHLVELTALLGQYAQNVFFLNAFDVDLPGDRTEPLLPV
jgi:4-carboxymuconolactone decarboxylase